MRYSHFAGDPDGGKGSSLWHARKILHLAAELNASGEVHITPTGQQLLAKMASYGPKCFRVDRRIAAEITTRKGRTAHPRHIARLRRGLARQGLISCKRVYAGGKIKTEKGIIESAHGCVQSTLCSKFFGEFVQRKPKPPKARPERPQRAAPPVQRGDYALFSRMAASAVEAQDARDDARGIAADQETHDQIRRARGHPP